MSLMSRVRSAAYAVLVAFHGLLLWQRIADATILEPGVLAKYAAAVVLLVAARLMPARVFWLIVLLLHAVSPVGEDAVVELALVAPLTVIAAAAALAAPYRLRALHPLSIAFAAGARPGHFVPLPARAPPFAR